MFQFTKEIDYTVNFFGVYLIFRSVRYWLWVLYRSLFNRDS